MVIYRIINNVNGDDYIGKTKHHLPKRLRNHYYKSNQGSQTYLHRAIRAYGINHFTIESVENQIPEDHIDERECYWIETLNPVYNLTKGGDGGDTSKSPNYIDGMAKRPKILTETHKQRISEGLKKSNRGRPTKMIESNKRRVSVLGEEFDSIQQAKQYLKDNNIRVSLWRRLKDAKSPEFYYL